MIAKVIAWGADRDQARRRLRRALSQTTVLIEGGTTNKSFLLDLVDRPEVVEGRVDTAWLDRLTASDGHRTDRFADVALLVAAIDVHDQERLLDRARFLSSAARGRPESDLHAGHDVELRWEQGEYRLRVATGDLSGWYRVTLDGVVADVVLDRLDDAHSRLTVGDRTYRVVSHTHRTEHLVEVEGVSHRFSRDDGGLLRAPAVSLVVSVEVGPGDLVVAGQRVAVVEAMKMETAVVAPTDGVVEDVFVSANVQVDVGAPLLRIGAVDAVEAAGADDGSRLRIEPAGLASGADATTGRLDVLRSLLLGFDVADSDAQVVEAHRVEADADDPSVRTRELELLRIFADLCGLTRDRRTAEGDLALEARSPLEHFHAYLRTLDAEHESLPERFRARLHDALAHYGVRSLDRTTALEAAVHSIHRAVQRRDEQVPVVQALLERRLAHCGEADELDDVRDTLDRLDRRDPGAVPLDRQPRPQRAPPLHRPTPHRRGARRRPRRGAALAAGAGGGSRRRGRRWTPLVATPVPLMAVIAAEDALGQSPELSAAVAEVLTRRFYKIRDLEDLDRRVDGHALVTAGYRHRGRGHRGDRRRLHARRPRRRAGDRGRRGAGRGHPRRGPVRAPRRRAAGGRRRGARRRRAVRRRGARRRRARRRGGCGRRGGRPRRPPPLLEPRAGRDVPRGDGLPGPAPDDRPAPAAVAARELRRHPAAGTRRRARLRLRGTGAAGRRAPRRGRRGARHHARCGTHRARSSPCPSWSGSSCPASTASGARRRTAVDGGSSGTG